MMHVTIQCDSCKTLGPLVLDKQITSADELKKWVAAHASLTCPVCFSPEYTIHHVHLLADQPCEKCDATDRNASA